MFKSLDIIQVLMHKQSLLLNNFTTYNTHNLSALLNCHYNTLPVTRKSAMTDFQCAE